MEYAAAYLLGVFMGAGVTLFAQYIIKRYGPNAPKDAP